MCVCVNRYLLDLIDEGVDEMFDLPCLGWEQDQFLIGQIELQHVLRGDGYKQDVCIAEKKSQLGLYGYFWLTNLFIIFTINVVLFLI